MPIKSADLRRDPDTPGNSRVDVVLDVEVFGGLTLPPLAPASVVVALAVEEASFTLHGPS